MAQEETTAQRRKGEGEGRGKVVPVHFDVARALVTIRHVLATRFGCRLVHPSNSNLVWATRLVWRSGGAVHTCLFCISRGPPGPSDPYQSVVTCGKWCWCQWCWCLVLVLVLVPKSLVPACSNLLFSPSTCLLLMLYTFRSYPVSVLLPCSATLLSTGPEYRCPTMGWLGTHAPTLCGGHWLVGIRPPLPLGPHYTWMTSIHRRY